jgi:cysteine desulfurase
VEVARQQVADLIGASAREVVFTSGGTEADNLALQGIARRYRSRGNHIITTRTEHPAVLRTCESLQQEGFRITYIDVGRDGVLFLEELVDTIDEQTVLISIMLANNETGTVQPVAEIGRIARGRGVLLHTDAVQGVGKTQVDVEQLNVDLLSLSAHKFHGPKGIGALFVRDGLELEPLILGGSHERNRRGGTENVPAIAGLGRACELAGEYLGDFGSEVGKLRDKMEWEILERVSPAVINGSTTSRLSHVSNISFCDIHGESLLVALDIEGVAVSTGAACSSGLISPSHVLTAMGLPEERVNGAIRFSLSRMSSEEDIEHLLEILPRVVSRMRETSPTTQS